MLTGNCVLRVSAGTASDMSNQVLSCRDEVRKDSRKKESVEKRSIRLWLLNRLNFHYVIVFQNKSKGKLFFF